MNYGGKTAGEIVSLFRRELNTRYPDQEIRAILSRLFEHLLGWCRATVILNKGKILDDQIGSCFLDTLRRLNLGEPIQYIIGSTEFCGLTLKVQPGVLIPRPETEELAILVTRENQKLREQKISILDLGTGSGCLALAMKRAFPNALVTGIEKYPDALDIARQNAADNGLEVTFREGDILHPATFKLPDSFHILLSNPPYIPESERGRMNNLVVDHEPEHALFVPDDHPLLFYEAIASIAMDHLKPMGSLYVEIHEEHGEITANLFRKSGFQVVEVIRDIYGKNRFVRASPPV
ncbi:MAG: peptide chain release factor N(5)-glutamine methyltransferase [Bacteroidota bacterium]